MTPERFAALADAYGGDLRRWPEAEQAEAGRHLQAAPDAAGVLARAGDLDEVLSAYDAPGPSLQLYHRITAQISAPPRAYLRLARWLSGLGVLGALAGGVAAGAAVVALSGPARPDWDGLDGLYEQSSFGGVAGLEDAKPDDRRSGAVAAPPEV